MEPRPQRLLRIGGRRLEQGEGIGGAAGEGELGAEPDPHVAMAEERCEVRDRQGRDVARQQPPGRVALRLFGGRPLRAADPVDPSLAGTGPALDVVEHVQIAVGAELAVGRQHVPDEGSDLRHREPGPARGEGDGIDAAAWRGAAEVAEKKPAGELGGQADAGVVAQAGGAGGEMHQRRQDVGRLPLEGGVPEFFPAPRAAVGKILKRHAPAAVSALDDLHESGLVAGVAVVVAGEQVAEVVEGEFLRVAQALVNHFQAAAVGLAPQHRAAVGDHDPVGADRDVEAAVTDGKIDPAVGAFAEAVHVVAEEGELHAEALVQRRPLVGPAVVVRVAEPPEVRDAGVVDGAVADEDAGADAVEDVVEAVGEDGRRLEAAVAVGIDEPAQPVVLAGVVVEVRPGVLLDKREPVFDRAGREVVGQPVHVAAVVLDALLSAKGFADEDPAAVVEREGDGIGKLRLGGCEDSLEAGGQADRGGAAGGFAGRGSDRGGVRGGLGGAADRRHGEGHGGEQAGRNRERVRTEVHGVRSLKT